MYTFPRHHLHYHVIIVLLLVWATCVKLDLFPASALGEFTLKAPSIACLNNIPQVALSWTPSAKVDTYSIQRKLGSDPTSTGFSGAIMSQLKTLNYTDNRYASTYGRTAYSYRVVAYKGGTRTYSNSMTAVLPECASALLVPATTTLAIATTTTTIITTTTVTLTTNAPKATTTILAQPQATTTVIVSSTTQTVVQNTSGKFPSWMKWGAFVGWQDTAMSSFESMTGKQPQMEAVFSHWGNDQFPAYLAPRIRDKGRTMVLFWEAVNYNRDYFSQPEYSFDSVIAGKMDPYFTKFAADAKAYKGEIILAPYSEFNGNWFPWGMTVSGNTPEKFIKAWIHIHSFFADVPNVKFAWVPNNDSVPDVVANNFDLNYPGSAYVDIVGLDAFNNTPWETFDQMLSAEIGRLKKYNKPIYLLSLGVKNDQRKAAWITDAFTVQLYKYPEVKGWVWFNENKEQDWRVNSSVESLQAFKNMIP